MAYSDAALHAEETLIRYKKNPIGAGGQGEVYKYKSGRKVYAIKVLEWKKDQSNRLSIIQEALISRHTRHQNVLQAHDMFTYEEGLALVMPYFPYGDLSKVAPRLSVFQLKEAIRQILYGLQYFHGQRQIHRDIKPCNVLVKTLEPLQVVIADFGLVSIANPITVLGTQGYQAPEIHQQRERKNPTPYTNAVDIYALGVLLLECLGLHLDPVSVLNEELHNRAVGSVIDQEMKKCEDIERRGGLILAGILTAFKANQRLSADEALQNTWLSPWFYIPYYSIPEELRDYPALEPESRPANNPLEAIALNSALEHYVGAKQYSTEYLAYILIHKSGSGYAYPAADDSARDDRIPDILWRLQASFHPVAVPRTYQQRDRLPYCVGQYVLKLGHPSTIKLLKTLADLLDDQPEYNFANAQARKTGFSSHPDQRTQTGPLSTKSTKRRLPDRRVLRGRTIEASNDSQVNSLKEQVRNTAARGVLQNAHHNASGGIQKRLRSSKRLSLTDKILKNTIPTTTDSAAKRHHAPHSRRSARKRPISDRMDFCSG